MSFYLKEEKNTVILKVKLVPKSSIDEITGVYGDALKIKIKAPPVEGKANKACCNYLAKIIGIPPKNISVIKGHKSKEKLICIENINSKIIKEKIKI